MLLLQDDEDADDESVLPTLTALDAPPVTVPTTPSGGSTSTSSGTTPRTHVSTTAKRKKTDAALDQAVKDLKGLLDPIPFVYTLIFGLW